MKPKVDAAGNNMPGFYDKEIPELKTYNWIMETVMRYGSMPKVLEVCHDNHVTNWDGTPFTKTSLISILTNTKYIGEWETNVNNKDCKTPDKLMSYERYGKAVLPHGCIVDRALWDRVQKKLAELSKLNQKNTKLRRIYPLSGLLRYKDGSKFHGSGRGANTRMVLNSGTITTLTRIILYGSMRKFLSAKHGRRCIQ